MAASEQPVDNLSDLPQLHAFITGHNSSGQAVLQAENDFEWGSFYDGNMAFSVVYATSSMPPDLNVDADLSTQKDLLNQMKGRLVSPSGTVLRCVDIAPGFTCPMHQTPSLDYGIVLEGEIEMLLDSGERCCLKRGDVAVQRATQHKWRNMSDTKWARMIYVLQDVKPLTVNGTE